MRAGLDHKVSKKQAHKCMRLVGIGSVIFLGAQATTVALAAETNAPIEAAGPQITMHVDLVSQYVARGLTSTYLNTRHGIGNALADGPESERPALQWGADVASKDGWYAGIFGSQINYSYRQLGRSYTDRTIAEYQKPRSIEHDIYGGKTGQLGDFTYDVGLTGYVYYRGEHANALETKLSLGYGPLSVGMQTLLNDVVWGNKGDTYWTINYAAPLPYDIAFKATLGFYTYDKNGKYLGVRDTLLGTDCGPNEAFIVSGCYAGNGPRSSGFRHLTLSFSQPIADTPLTWSLQLTGGGVNRFGIRQKPVVVGSLIYSF